MTFDMNPDNFTAEFNALPSQPKQARYRHPDGTEFRVAHLRTDGTVVTETGRWITPDEWTRVERLG